MNILAVDTSGPLGSAAACRDEEIVAEERFEKGLEHGRMLVSLVDRLLARAGWDKQRQVDLVAAGLGPGSFTGLRVGVTFAKTFCMVAGVPLVGVCSLDAMAENAPADAQRVLTVLDARRGDVYAAAYERRGDALARVHGPSLMKPAEALGLLAAPRCVMGDALRVFPDLFVPPDCAPHAGPDAWNIRASVVARLGKAAFLAGDEAEPVVLQPIYVRLAEAEEKRLAREKGQV